MGKVMIEAVAVEKDVLSKVHTPEKVDVTLFILSLQFKKRLSGLNGCPNLRNSDSRPLSLHFQLLQVAD